MARRPKYSLSQGMMCASGGAVSIATSNEVSMLGLDETLKTPDVDAGTLVATYRLPRDGEVLRCEVSTRGDLRALRAELELLRRIGRRLTLSGLPEVTPNSSKYSSIERAELAAIVRDARNPIVEEVIRLVDVPFCDIRKEIMMSAIENEAENIAYEAVESGAVEEVQSGSENNVLDALAAAEEQLAEVVTQVCPDAMAEAQETAQEAVESAQADETSPVDEEVVDSVEASESCDIQTPCIANDETTVDEDTNDVLSADEQGVDKQTGTEVPATDQADEVQNTPAEQTEQPDQVDQGGTFYDAPGDVVPVYDRSTANTVQQTFSVNKRHVKDLPTTTQSSTLAGSSKDVTPERAEQAVLEIERGIRKLAGMLSGEVNDQWKEAKATLNEVAQFRGKIEQVGADARELLEEMKRVKEEVAIARDDANLARRETRLFREDALRAKQQAEKCAAAIAGASQPPA